MNNWRIFLVIFVILAVTLACGLSTSDSPDQGESSTQKLYDGITYIREVRTSPRDMVIHIVKIKVSKSNIQPLVTPADNPKSDTPYNARTTSEFLKEFKLNIAINGSGFHPWHDYGVSYYPHSGDPVSPLGSTISGKFEYLDEGDESRPVVMFGGNRPVAIGYVDRDVNYAVSGIRILVEKGEVSEGLENGSAEPRTAVGVDSAGHNLIIVVVDGRQAGYSEGASLAEIAQILIDNGAQTGLELDGGGSSTLVVKGKDGNVQVLNSPVHQGIPGNERPVANHLGFKVK